MKSVSENKRTPNRLIHGMISISMCIHLLIFMHIAGIYRSEALTYIELTLQDVSKPFTRSIPRPRMRHKTPKIRDAKKLNIKTQHIPKMKIDPVENNFTDTLMENIAMPNVPDSSGFNISDFNPDGISDFVTTNDYFAMVRLKIESKKRYPDSARSKHIEGRVKIRFVVTTDGQVSSLKIIKHARHSSLDKAALNAVQDAAPFPKPPRGLFKGPIHMEITIVFELT